MVDFHSYLQYAENLITTTTKGFFAKLDGFTFKMMIDGLKREDYQAVTIIIEQIVKERRPVSIPPLYVVAKKHPNDAVRHKADQALNQLDQQGEVLTHRDHVGAHRDVPSPLPDRGRAVLVDDERRGAHAQRRDEMALT